MILWLIILNFFWSGAAWAYDYDKLITIPLYLWPVVAVCPIYPLLLALVLSKLYRKKSPNQFLFAFAAVPSAIFGIIALMFYPIAMIYQGFSWNAVGQIFWVGVYALQGIWLLKTFKISVVALYSALGFMALQIAIVEILYKSFGYFDFSYIPSSILVIIAALGFLFFSIIFEVLIRKR